MAKEAKTNAMRMLDRQKVKYETLAYECDEFIDGIHCADITGAPYEQSFKTLVMEGKSGGYYAFRISPTFCPYGITYVNRTWAGSAC